MEKKALDWAVEGMDKEAFFGQLAGPMKSVADATASAAGFAKNVGTLAATGIGTVILMKAVMNRLNNDTVRKNLVEDLLRTDPILRSADKNEVMNYYATIYNVAPTLSKDRNAVRELLVNFVKFGRVDLQTIKMLADTEKSLASYKDSFDMGAMLKNIVK